MSIATAVFVYCSYSSSSSIFFFRHCCHIPVYFQFHFMASSYRGDQCSNFFYEWNEIHPYSIYILEFRYMCVRTSNNDSISFFFLYPVSVLFLLLLLLLIHFDFLLFELIKRFWFLVPRSDTLHFLSYRFQKRKNNNNNSRTETMNCDVVPCSFPIIMFVCVVFSSSSTFVCFFFGRLYFGMLVIVSIH